MVQRFLKSLMVSALKYHLSLNLSLIRKNLLYAKKFFIITTQITAYNSIHIASHIHMLRIFKNVHAT